MALVLTRDSPAPARGERWGHCNERHQFRGNERQVQMPNFDEGIGVVGGFELPDGGTEINSKVFFP